MHILTTTAGEAMGNGSTQKKEENGLFQPHYIVFKLRIGLAAGA